MNNEDLTLVFKALSHPSRREILDWLKTVQCPLGIYVKNLKNLDMPL